MFLLWLRQWPRCGDWTSASVPPPAECRSSLTNTPAAPSSFLLPSFAWVYLFFSTGQFLLSALSWCPACTSVSEGVFLMHPWREIYSTSTYSSAILSPLGTFFKCECLVLTYLPSTEFYQILISSSKKWVFAYYIKASMLES